MADRLAKLISEAIDLLSNCGWQGKADWFRDVQMALNHADPKSPEFRALIKMLDESLTGMGSFSDLPLRSQSGKFTDQQLREKQWTLVEELGDAVAKLK